MIHLQLPEELVSGVIDVDPEYQREVVWTGESVQLDHYRSMLTVIVERMTGLINSLMGIVPQQRQRHRSSLNSA
jgi:hypothetical protein